MKPVSFVLPASKNVIRLVRMGCSNRPYYQIGVMPSERRHGLPANEVIGSYDPMPNERNEKLFAVDLDRLAYWIGEGASVTVPLSSLLGLVGYFPIHGRVLQKAWNNRQKAANPSTSQEDESS